MEFLYPKFNTVTHKILKDAFVSIEYPFSSAFNTKRDYNIREGANIAIIEENLGYKCAWAKIKIIDQSLSSAEYFNKDVYVPTISLAPVLNKKTFSVICDKANEIDISAEEINPNLKDIFIPYVDKRNGLYSVRVQIDYDRIIDSVFFQNVLEEVFLEGVNVLLASRGFRSDNSTINELKNTYFTFAYINNDLDLTVNRACEPLTFTVSIPLRFFNNFQIVGEERTLRKATKFINFTNKNFVSTIDKLIAILSSRATDIFNLTYPNKFLEGFVLDFEISSLKRFAISTGELMEIGGVPINTSANTILEYSIGLDDDLNLISIDIKIQRGEEIAEIFFNESLLAQCRLRSEFNSKRIFNYLLNIDGMRNEVQTTEIVQFLKKYVKYPDVALLTSTIKIGNTDISPERSKQFKISFEEKKESCLKLSDINNLAYAGTDLVDSIFDIFIQQTTPRPNNTTVLEQFKENFSQIKQEYAASAPTGSSDVSQNNDKINIELSDGLTEAATVLNQTYSFNINTLNYILARVDIQKILFNNLLCALKGLDPNAKETADIISQIPQEIINYFNYLQSLKDLKGTQWVKAVQSGITVDYKLFCTKNADLIYFIKGLTKFLNGANILANQFYQVTIDLAKNSKIENPYKKLVTSLISNVEQQIAGSLFDLISQLLRTNCSDPSFYSGTDNFADPYGTHQPIVRGARQENNNQTALKNNRREALEDSIPEVVRQLQFGSDIEYTVDLLDLLLRDINCILTPQESVELIRGNASDVVEALIVNLIRNKYSEDPNNLSFLIRDRNKMLLFFKRLGSTVDPQIIETIETQVTNEISPSVLCSPQQLEARKQLIQNKLPDLSTLDSQLRRRTREARKILETIKSGGREINISGLCPDIDDPELDSVKNNIIQKYIDYLRSTFSPVLTAFTDEALKSSQVFSEQQVLERKKDDGTIFDSLAYTNWLSSLKGNLNSVQTRENTRDQSFSILYRPVGQEIDGETLAKNLFGPTIENNVNIICEGPYEEDPEFRKFLSRNTLVYERPIIGEFFSENELNNNYSQEILKNLTDNTISLSVTINAVFSETATFKYIFNQSANQKFRILEKNSIKDQAFSNDLERVAPITGGKKFVVITNEIFNQLSENSKNILQENFIRFQRQFGSKIQTLDLVQDSLEIFSENGLFQITSQLFKDNKFVRQVKITTKKYDPTQKVAVPDTKEYFDYTTVLENDPLNPLGFSNDLEKSLSYSKQQNDSGLFVNAELASFNNILDMYSQTAIKTLYKLAHNKLSDTRSATFYEDLNKSNILAGNNPPKNRYLKDIYFAEEFISSKNSDKSFEDLSSDSDIRFSKNPDYDDLYQQNFAKFRRFDFSQDLYFKNCNIYPHYLNLDYFLNIAFDSAKETLCDNNLTDIPNDLLDEIIVNMTVRAYITDLLIKAIPYLSLRSRKDLDTLHTNETIVDILRGAFERETYLFSPQNPQNLKDNQYYEYFIRKTKRVYKKYENATTNLSKLRPQFISSDMDDINKEINYFIRREIRHFIKYCLDKDIFTPLEKNLYEFLEKDERVQDNFFDNIIIADRERYFITIDTEPFKSVKVYSFVETFFNSGEKTFTRAKNTFIIKNSFTEKLIKNEFDTMLVYFIMANTVDYNKRTLYHETKTNLASIFSSTLAITEKEQSTVFDDNSRSNEDVIKFINNLAYTPNPAALILLKPQYSKYIKFFIEATLNSTRQTVLDVASLEDVNIQITRKINFGLAAASTIGWSLVEENTRQELILNANNEALALLYKRLEEGRSLLPDIAVSTGLGLSTQIWPGLLGYSYLLLDSLEEINWFVKSLEEIRSLQGLNVADDPCKPPESPQFTPEPILCTEERRKELKAKVNSYEEI